MKIPKDSFVVGIIENGEVQRFYSTDDRSGGYPWFPENISSARVFNAIGEATKIANELGKKANDAPVVMSGGDLHPNGDVSGALDMSGMKTKAEGHAVVFKISLEEIGDVAPVYIHGEIKKATGFRYD